MPRRRRGAIPLADARALKGLVARTTLVRLALACLLLTLAAFTVWRATQLDPQTISFLPEGSTTVLVLDESKSISVPAFRRGAAVLRQPVAVARPVGSFPFSDTAYEMLPPGARSPELKSLLRFYTPSRVGTNIDPETRLLVSPWENVFSGGTSISSGLNLAEWMLHRDHVRNGSILLFSDLETAAEDQPALARALVTIANDPRVQLRVVPLFPIATDEQFFQRFLPGADFVTAAELKTHAVTKPRTLVVGGTPTSLLLVGAFLLVALAANELFCTRLRLHRPREEAA